jgi:uncharacterized protein YqjF (DUF2071 family)
MKASEILAMREHRPWPVPRGPWIMRQTWDDLLFAHWPLPPDALRPHIPPGLPLDTYDGQAWIGVVPFRMRDVRPRFAPALPWLSAFPELNVRTYVTLGGKPGVYFFSLDAGNPLAVRVARTFFHLLYFNARFAIARKDGAMDYRSQRTDRRGASAELAIHYRPTGPVHHSERGSLTEFLTERYCLYSANPRGQLFRCEIHHPRWPLQPAEAEIAENTMVSAAGVALPATPPLLHYAQHLEVLVWNIQRVGSG